MGIEYTWNPNLNHKHPHVATYITYIDVESVVYRHFCLLFALNFLMTFRETHDIRPSPSAVVRPRTRCNLLLWAGQLEEWAMKFREFISSHLPPGVDV